MALHKWAIFIKGVYGENSHFLSDRTESLFLVIFKKRWHTSWKFQLEITSNKNVIAKKPLTNLYKTNSRSLFSLQTKAVLVYKVCCMIDRCLWDPSSEFFSCDRWQNDKRGAHDTLGFIELHINPFIPEWNNEPFQHCVLDIPTFKCSWFFTTLSCQIQNTYLKFQTVQYLIRGLL